MRLNGTDDEARAVGRHPTTPAFSWTDSLRHISQFVIGSSVIGQHAQFDLTDVRLESDDWRVIATLQFKNGTHIDRAVA